MSLEQSDTSNIDLDSAKALAASLKFTKKEISKLRDEVKESLQEVVGRMVKTDRLENKVQRVHKVPRIRCLQGPRGFLGPQGEQGPEGPQGLQENLVLVNTHKAFRVFREREDPGRTRFTWADGIDGKDGEQGPEGVRF